MVSFLQVSQPKPCIHLFSPHTRYMSRPSHSSRFYHPINFGWGLKFIKLLIMYFSPFPVTSSLLGPNILLNTIFSSNFSLHSSLNMSDQISHPQTQQAKIIVLYILIFTFLDSRLEDKNILHRMKANISWLQSVLNFWEEFMAKGNYHIWYAELCLRHLIQACLQQTYVSPVL